MKKILLSGFILALPLLFTGCGSSTTTNQSQTSTVNKEYAVKEVIKLKNHQLVVNSAVKNWKSSNEFDQPQSTANMFVLVNVTLTKTSNEKVDFNPYGFKLEDDTGVQRDTTFTTVSNQLESATLSPNGKTSGNLVFEAKKASKKLLLHYEGSTWSGDQPAVIKL